MDGVTRTAEGTCSSLTQTEGGAINSAALFGLVIRYAAGCYQPAGAGGHGRSLALKSPLLVGSSTAHLLYVQCVCVVVRVGSLYWGVLVIKNVLFCTIAGTVADWWFNGQSLFTQATCPHLVSATSYDDYSRMARAFAKKYRIRKHLSDVPVSRGNRPHLSRLNAFHPSLFMFSGEDTTKRHVVLSSLKRASTTSLGSICLGSLIVAILSVSAHSRTSWDLSLFPETDHQIMACITGFAADGTRGCQAEQRRRLRPAGAFADRYYL